ncbi:MAG TPA: DUF2165 domain-containing protein [Chitinophagaceae bacterium]|nr:DUF2165 domain-containing protein [Chitinophagaceae bacterium]
MKTTAYAVRAGKCTAVAGIALMSLLVVFGNITDYYSNFYFVQHVMKMDTIFPSSEIHYRAVDSNLLYHISYILIILAELLMAACCMAGSVQMIKNISGSATQFHAAKKWAVYGCIIGFAIWFIGFEVVGGEWFGMWQSSTWNGLYSADRIVTFIALAFIMLQMKEEEMQ